jgi:hypothetical protein
MHISTWLRLADLGDGELKPEDRQELLQAAIAVRHLLFARPIPPEDAAREMARVCGLKGSEIERWRQEQAEFMATILIGFNRYAPDTVTLSDGSVHKVEHEKLGDIYKRLAKRHDVKPRTIKDWVRKHLR